MVVGTCRESPRDPDDACATRELWSLDDASPLADSAPALHSSASRDADAGGVAGGVRERAPLRIGNWLRERLRRKEDALTLPALREPSCPEIPPLRRGTVEAWWSARRARVDLDEFLRDRLAGYVARSRISPERLPVSISVDAGRVVVARRPGGSPAAPWLARYVRAYGEPALAADLERASVETARTEAALDDARGRLAEARHELEAAARAPALAWSDSDETSPYGRPAVPPPWSYAIGAFVGVMVLGNAWQFALPLLRGAGVSPAEIALEASRRPEAVILPLLLALGASACLFIFSAAAIRRARSLIDVLPPRWHGAVHAIAGGVSLGMAIGLAWAILVPGASAVGRARDVTSFLVAIALPFATPPLLTLARRLYALRADASRAAAAWDHVHRAALVQWTRMNALASATERECSALEATRAAWTQRSYLLRSRAAEVARLAADEAESEASDLRHLSEAIVAALELDRRAYLGDGRPRRAVARTEPLPADRERVLDAAR